MNMGINFKGVLASNTEWLLVTMVPTVATDLGVMTMCLVVTFSDC